jgi:8-oxo-dGTP diphosphatase
MNLFTLSNAVIEAVKAIIYRSDGRILLQQRDYTFGILFPGTWTCFGGQVETGEDLKNALLRELDEELGCVPGQLGDELFQWMWHGKNPAQHYYFPVFCEVDDDALVLNEGLAMSWFSFDKLQDIILGPDVSANLQKIAHFVERSLKDRIDLRQPECG